MASVLIVDDDQFLARALARGLEAAHFVVEAATTREALAAHQAYKFDVMFADYHLGRESGLDLIDTVRTRFPHVRLVLMSAASLETDVLAQTQAYGARFLQKPFGLRALTAILVPTKNGI